MFERCSRWLHAIEISIFVHSYSVHKILFAKYNYTSNHFTVTKVNSSVRRQILSGQNERKIQMNLARSHFLEFASSFLHSRTETSKTLQKLEIWRFARRSHKNKQINNRNYIVLRRYSEICGYPLPTWLQHLLNKGFSYFLLR